MFPPASFTNQYVLKALLYSKPTVTLFQTIRSSRAEMDTNISFPLAQSRQLRRSERLRAQQQRRISPSNISPSISQARGRQVSLVTQLEQVRLTRENLALFNKMTNGGVTTSSSRKTTSTTSSGFAIQAAKNGILSRHNSKPPTNNSAIRRRYAASRATSSPTESEFNRYVKRTEYAPNEATIAADMQELVLKRYDDGHYQRSLNQAFTGFPNNVGLNNGLSSAQPDFVQGLSIDQYQPVPVDEVNGAVLYADNPTSITLPHIAGEWKRPGGNLKRAEMQAGYDGAALTYARNQALGRMGTSDAASHSHIATFATDGRILDIYAHYADSKGRYHQHRVTSADLESSQGFKDGYRTLRNAQDHAREESYRLRDQLHAHHRGERGRYIQAEREGCTQAGQVQYPTAAAVTPILGLVGACLLLRFAPFLALGMLVVRYLVR